jgi:hypothetical protein
VHLQQLEAICSSGEVNGLERVLVLARYQFAISASMVSAALVGSLGLALSLTGLAVGCVERVRDTSISIRPYVLISDRE